MTKHLILKCIGTRELIEDLVKNLEDKYIATITSSWMPREGTTNEFSVYVTIIPKTEVK